MLTVIEGFCHRLRSHASIGYRSPVDIERVAADV